MRIMVGADNKEKNESAMVNQYPRVNHFQKGDGGVRYADVRDRERCDGDRGRDCGDRCDNVLPASVTDCAPFQAIHS